MALCVFEKRSTVEELRRILATLTNELEAHEEWRALRQLDEREKTGQPLASIDGVLFRGRLVQQLSSKSPAWRAYASIERAIVELERGQVVLPDLFTPPAQAGTPLRVEIGSNAKFAVVGAAQPQPPIGPDSEANGAEREPGEVMRTRVKVRAGSLAVANSPPRDAGPAKVHAGASRLNGHPIDVAEREARRTREPLPALRRDPLLRDPPPAPAHEPLPARAAQQEVRQPSPTSLHPAHPSGEPGDGEERNQPLPRRSILDRIQTVQSITTSPSASLAAAREREAQGIWGERATLAPEPDAKAAAPASGHGHAPASVASDDGLPVRALTKPSVAQTSVKLAPSAEMARTGMEPARGSAGITIDEDRRLGRVELELERIIDEETRPWTKPLASVEQETTRRRTASPHDFDTTGIEFAPDEAEVEIIRLERPRSGSSTEFEADAVAVLPRTADLQNGASDQLDDELNTADYAAYHIDVDEAEVEIVIRER